MNPLLNSLLKKKQHTKTSVIRKIIISIEIILVITLVWSCVEPFLIQIKKSEVLSNDVPKDFDGYKIVFVSDIHCDFFNGKSRISKLVQKINDQNPNIILLGGDYGKTVNYVSQCFKYLNGLKATDGKYGVLGNHDVWASSSLSEKYMTSAQISSLNNRSKWIYRNGSRIKLGGVGDLWSQDPDLKPTTLDTIEKDFVILVSHNPDYINQINSNNIDLMLSGHTHGGQITFFGLTDSNVQKFRNDQTMFGKTRVIVSNGIGSFFAFPLRFFARPQINVITLKHED